MPVLRHPNLPGRTIDVGDRAAKAHRRSGWVDDGPPALNASTDDWATFAASLGHDIPEGATRAELIDLVGPSGPGDPQDDSDEEE